MPAFCRRLDRGARVQRRWVRHRAGGANSCDHGIVGCLGTSSSLMEALTTVGRPCPNSLTVPQVVGVNLFRNFGQHNALLAGIRQASIFRRRHDGRRSAASPGDDPHPLAALH